MTNSKATTGSHVSLNSDYCDGDAIIGNTIFEIVDYNMRWGFRVVPVSADESGRLVRDFRESRWVDRDAIDRVFS